MYACMYVCVYVCIHLYAPQFGRIFPSLQDYMNVFNLLINFELCFGPVAFKFWLKDTTSNGVFENLSALPAVSAVENNMAKSYTLHCSCLVTIVLSVQINWTLIYSPILLSHTTFTAKPISRLCTHCLFRYDLPFPPNTPTFLLQIPVHAIYGSSYYNQC